MAKTREELKKLQKRVIPFKYPGNPTCDCGKPAEYEVYDHREPHCRSCMLDAVDCQVSVMVRRIEGGYFDDAS